MVDKRVKESISFYRSGVAYAAKEEGGHLTGQYDIQRDEVAEDGTRTIVLKPHDLTEFNAKLERLVELLMVQLKESKSSMGAKILKDTLIDYEEEDIDRMLKKMEGGKDKVTAQEGCFKIYIGDGRKKGSEEIMLRG